MLVYHDLLGLTEGHLPRFVKRYASLSREIRDALEHYAEEVRDGTFPGDEHTYAMPEEELELFRSSINPSATRANAHAKEPTMSASKSLSPAPESEPPAAEDVLPVDRKPDRPHRQQRERDGRHREPDDVPRLPVRGARTHRGGDRVDEEPAEPEDEQPVERPAEEGPEGDVQAVVVRIVEQPPGQ